MKIYFIKEKNKNYTKFYEWIGKNVTLFVYLENEKFFIEFHTENLEPFTKGFKNLRNLKKYLKKTNFFHKDLKELNNIKKIIFIKSRHIC